jgi:hypothetical protein
MTIAEYVEYANGAFDGVFRLFSDHVAQNPEPYISFVAVFWIVGFVRSIKYDVAEDEVIVLERFWRFNRILTTGTHLSIPLIETPRSLGWPLRVHWYFGHKMRRFFDVHHEFRLDMKDRTFGPIPIYARTRDGVDIEVPVVIHTHVEDIRKVAYGSDGIWIDVKCRVTTAIGKAVGAFDMHDIGIDALMSGVGEVQRAMLETCGVRITEVTIVAINRMPDPQYPGLVLSSDGMCPMCNSKYRRDGEPSATLFIFLGLFVFCFAVLYKLKISPPSDGATCHPNGIGGEAYDTLYLCRTPASRCSPSLPATTSWCAPSAMTYLLPFRCS